MQEIPKLSIGIIGYGVVGQAVEHGFKGHDILIFDKFKKSDTLEKTVAGSNFIFICLPTPMIEDEGGIDLSIIEDTIAQIVPYTNKTDKIIIIKSTVIPGTTHRLINLYPESSFCFNPEFLTENNYLADFLQMKNTIIGSVDPKVKTAVSKLYHSNFPKIKIVEAAPTEAELAKYMINCYLALKVMYANEMFDLSQALGVNYQQVKKLVTEDERIFDSHLEVTPERGFGGKCFPKDMVSLLYQAQGLGVDMRILKTAWEQNKQIRKFKDWENIQFVITKKA